MYLNLNFEEDKKKLKLLGDALSNLTRIYILEEIKKSKGEGSHKQIAENLGIKSSSVTFHMNILKDAELVTEEMGKGLKGRNNKQPRLLTNKITIEL